MLTLDHHNHGLCAQLVHQGVCNLAGQTLLYLRTLSKQIHQARQLGQSGHLAGLARNIADVGDAEERHKMVLAGGIDRNVPDQHQLLVILRKRLIQHVRRFGVQASEHFRIRASHPCRGFQQALTVWVLPYRDEQLAHGSLGALTIKHTARHDRPSGPVKNRRCRARGVPGIPAARYQAAGLFCVGWSPYVSGAPGP